MATFGAAISEHPDAAQAIGEAVGVVHEQVGEAPDLAILFVSGHPPETVGELADAVNRLLRPEVLIGSTAVAVIGGPVEAEERPAISLWAGRTGRVEPIRLEVTRSPDGTAVVGMPEVAATGDRTLILLSEPFSFPAEALARATNSRHPHLTIIGGVASEGGPGPGTNRLVLGRDVHDQGAVGALLPAGLGEVAVVSQGCRPIGNPLIVTAAEGNVIHELGSRPAMERLSETYDEAGPEDQELLSRGLHIGVVVDERSERFDHGDFLIRAVLGTDHSTGGLRVGARVEVGTTVQFHVRDMTSASEDLRRALTSVSADAALLFTCNGRGARLFERAGHDAEMLFTAIDRGPLAGMFCAGEFGPVGGENHVHGFTASVLLLYG